MKTPVIFPEFFMWLGPYKWPMVLLSALVLILVIKKAVEMFMPGLTVKRKASGVNAILFWGAMSMALGIYVQTASLWVALQEIIKAADISPAMVIIGFYGSFTSTIMGTLTLMFAALAWWGFRYWLRRF